MIKALTGVLANGRRTLLLGLDDTNVARLTSDHPIKIDGGEMCLRCGETQPFTYPARVQIITAIADAFTKLHKNCKPHPDGDACHACGGRGHTLPDCPRAKATTPEEWIHGPDTGLSSKTIWSVMMGNSAVLGMWGATEPADPDDFGRCYRLLQKFPEWRARMPEVAAKYPRWAKLVAAWDELTRLFEEESKRTDKQAPKLYARMQSLRA
jgi:hypothetical protein